MKELKKMEKLQNKYVTSDDRVRTLDEFMQDQAQYEAKKNQRIQEVLDQR